MDNSRQVRNIFFLFQCSPIVVDLVVLLLCTYRQCLYIGVTETRIQDKKLTEASQVHTDLTLKEKPKNKYICFQR